MQDDETMLKRTFKLKTSTFAILSERDQRSVVTIPAQSLVTLIVGDPDGDGLVKIRYRDQILLMFLTNADPHSESHSS
jgi:hypothetical protein